MMSEQPDPTPTIYLDADACPIKDVVYKVAARYGVPLKVVANGYLRIPAASDARLSLVLLVGSQRHLASVEQHPPLDAFAR